MRNIGVVFQALLLALLSLALAPAAPAAPPDTVTIAVMATTDLHGWVLPWDYGSDRPEPRFGLSKVATLVDSVRAVHEHTLLLDAGDWLQGNALAEYFARVDTLGRYPLLRAVDAIGYDAVVIGNHEFNFGIELLNRRIAQTETPIIGANIYGYGTDEPAYVPYIIRELGGVRVGIVGLTTPGSLVWDRSRVQGRLDFADGVDAARRWVAEAREQGAEVIIVLAHSGLDGPSSYPEDGIPPENFGRAVAEQVPGVDLLVLGHWHRVMQEVIPGYGGREIGVIMPGRWGSHLGVVELTVVREDDGARIIGQAIRAHPVIRAESDARIEALVAPAHEAVRAWINQPLARTTGPWPTAESRLRPTAAVDLIHAVQLEATGVQLSATSAFTTAATLGPEVITLAQVTQLYPYENTLYVVEISGADLRAYIDHGMRYYLPPEEPGAAPRVNPAWPGFNFDAVAGVEYVVDLRRPVGERVVSLTFGGRDVRDDEVFTMVVNSYRAEGGGAFPGMGAAAVIRRFDVSVRDLIADYLRERGTISPEEVRMSRWSVMPRPQEGNW